MPTSSQALRQLRSSGTGIDHEIMQLGAADVLNNLDLLKMANLPSWMPNVAGGKLQLDHVEAVPGGDVIQMFMDEGTAAYPVAEECKQECEDGAEMFPPTNAPAPSISFVTPTECDLESQQAEKRTKIVRFVSCAGQYTTGDEGHADSRQPADPGYGLGCGPGDGSGCVRRIHASEGHGSEEYRSMDVRVQESVDQARPGSGRTQTSRGDLQPADAKSQQQVLTGRVPYSNHGNHTSKAFGPVHLQGVLSNKGGCGVLTLNTNKGRHEWTLLDSLRTSSCRKGFRGISRKASTRSSRHTLPSVHWVSPYEKMQQVRELQTNSRQKTPLSILDLSQRMGKGISMTRLLTLSGRHIHLDGEAAPAISNPWTEDSGDYKMLVAGEEETTLGLQDLRPPLASVVVPGFGGGDEQEGHGGEGRAQHWEDVAGRQGKCYLTEEQLQAKIRRMKEHKEQCDKYMATNPRASGSSMEHQRVLNRPVGYLQQSEVSKQVYRPQSDIGGTTCATRVSSRGVSVGSLSFSPNYTGCGDEHRGAEAGRMEMAKVVGEAEAVGKKTDGVSVRLVGGESNIQYVRREVAGFKCPTLKLEGDVVAATRSVVSLASLSARTPVHTQNEIKPEQIKMDKNYGVEQEQPAVKEAGLEQEAPPSDLLFNTSHVKQPEQQACTTDLNNSEVGGVAAPAVETKLMAGPVIPPPFSKKAVRRCYSSASETSVIDSSSALLLARLDHDVARLRNEIPASDPNKLCFQSNIPGCTHAEILECLEAASPGIKVASLQYVPVQLHDYMDFSYAASKFKCMWLFRLKNGSSPTELLLKGLRLRGRRMNIRCVDEVCAEEHATFIRCWEKLRRGYNNSNNNNNSSNNNINNSNDNDNNNNNNNKTDKVVNARNDMDRSSDNGYQAIGRKSMRVRKGRLSAWDAAQKLSQLMMNNKLWLI